MIAPYMLKFDGGRKVSRLWWTAVGPRGRLGDVMTRDEAVALINADAGCIVRLTGPMHEGCCLLWTGGEEGQ